MSKYTTTVSRTASRRPVSGAELAYDRAQIAYIGVLDLPSNDPRRIAALDNLKETWNGVPATACEARREEFDRTINKNK